ncbi:MAG: TolC family protein [Bacteroidota bacterium]
MSEAVEKGLQNNYAIRLADINTQIARNNNSWGNAGRWPRLDLNVNGSAARSGNPASFVPGRESTSAGLNFNWTLFDGFAIQANKARFELLQEQSEGNAAVVIETNVQAIMLGYYNVLLATSQLNILQEVLNNSRERLNYEAFRKELGSTGTFDILQFKNAYLVDSTNLIAQELILNNAQRTLSLVMGEEVNAIFTLTDTLPVTYPAYVYEDLVQAMSSNNQNLKNQFVNQQIRLQESRIAQAGRYPVVGINAGSTYALGRVLRRNFDPATVEIMPTIAQNFNAFDYNAGFTLSFNLYNGKNLKRQIQQAHLNELLTEVQGKELEQSLANELRLHFDNYQARIRIFQLQTYNVANANLNLELASERFQSGLINSFDYRTIQLQYRNAQLSKLQALRNLKESETELIRLTGGFIQQK